MEEAKPKRTMKETPVQNNLYVEMAKKGIRSVTKLSEQIENVSYKQLYMFAKGDGYYIDPEVLAAVCETLDCKIGDLLTIKSK